MFGTQSRKCECENAPTEDDNFNDNTCQCNSGYAVQGPYKSFFGLYNKSQCCPQVVNSVAKGNFLNPCYYECADGYDYDNGKCKSKCAPNSHFVAGKGCECDDTYVEIVSGRKKICVLPASQKAIRKHQQNPLSGDALYCPAGLSACPVQGAQVGAFECLDPTGARFVRRLRVHGRRRRLHADRGRSTMGCKAGLCGAFFRAVCLPFSAG